MVEALALASLAAWLYLAIFHGAFWELTFPSRRAPMLPDEASGLRVAIVIPARNEAEHIGAAVRSLVQQDWPGHLEIWVVDDSSSDGTADVALKQGAKVVRAGVLPQGWTGKVWAMAAGVAQASTTAPDYILFTDADIVHDAHSIRSLVARAETEKLDLVSVMVRLNCRTTAERLLIPAFVFFFFMLYPPRWIASRTRRTAGAAGGCILLRPSALRGAGGLEAIRGELIDDCALARAVKKTGAATWLGMSATTFSSREYRSFREMRSMIARTAFTQLRYSMLLLAATIAGMLLLYVVPVASAVTGGLAGAAAWALMAGLYAPMLRFYGQPRVLALLLPFEAVFYLAATVESAIRYRTGRGGAWKGRHQAPAVTEAATGAARQTSASRRGRHPPGLQ